MGIYDTVGIEGRTLDAPSVYEPEELRPSGPWFSPAEARLKLAELEQLWQRQCAEYNGLQKALQQAQERLNETQGRIHAVETLLRQYRQEVDPFEPIESKSFEEALAESETFGLPDMTPSEALEMHQEHD